MYRRRGPQWGHRGGGETALAHSGGLGVVHGSDRRGRHDRGTGVLCGAGPSPPGARDRGRLT